MTRIFYALLLALLLSACRPEPQAAPEPTPTPVAAPVSPTPTPTGSTPAAPAPTPAPTTGLLMRLETDGDLAVGAVPIVVYVLNDAEGVSGATVQVTGDMTHAEMAPVTAQATETEPGLYRAEGFEFTMAGDWLLTAVATLPGGEKTSAELGVTVPGQ